MMTGPVQDFRSAIWDAWRFHVFARLSERQGLLGSEFSDFHGSLQLVTCGNEIQFVKSHFLWEGVGTDSFLARPRKTFPSFLARPRRKTFLVVFVERGMVMVTYSGSVLCPPLSLQHVRDLPEFAYLMSLDRSKWPRCLLWHGCLPGLNGIDKRDPRAASFGDSASFHLERCLGAHPVDCAGSWTPPDCWDADDIALEMPEYPNIWTDGSREDFSSIGGFEVAGAGVYLPASELAFDGSIWGTAEEYGDARLERCRAFQPVPGVLQTVQRAEFWGAILALQAYWPCHVGIDNLNVARSIGRLLDHDSLVKPLPSVKDGDFTALAQYMIRTRDRETVRVTKVKEHAEDVDVQQGRVRLVDRQGNAVADTATDLGRRHQSEVLIDARRRLLKVRGCSYPIMLELHRFMIAIARVSINHDGRGGTAPDPLVWDQGGRPKTRKIGIRVNIDLASLPGPPGFLGGPLDPGSWW